MNYINQYLMASKTIPGFQPDRSKMEGEVGATIVCSKNKVKCLRIQTVSIFTAKAVAISHTLDNFRPNKITNAIILNDSLTLTLTLRLGIYNCPPTQHKVYL